MRLLALALLSGWLAGCAAAPVPDGAATIYVVGRSWHTDIVLPADALAGPLTSLEGEFPGVRYMAFGFGERNYYMAREAGSGEMLAALLPSKSAILMTALRVPPPQAFPDQEVVTLRLPPADVQYLAALIWAELDTSANGAPIRLAEGPYLGSTFYASKATYDLFYTCNTWTARMLRDAGIPVQPNGVLFASQVMDQVKWIAAVQARVQLEAK